MYVSRTSNSTLSAATDLPTPMEKAKARDDAASTSLEAAPHEQDPDVVRLAEQARLLPEARPEVVAAALDRLGRGDYLTRAAAAQTAARLLGG